MFDPALSSNVCWHLMGRETDSESAVFAITCATSCRRHMCCAVPLTVSFSAVPLYGSASSGSR